MEAFYGEDPTAGTKEAPVAGGLFVISYVAGEPYSFAFPGPV